MPGFIIAPLQDSLNLSQEERKDLIVKRINTNELCIEQRTVNKFLNDKPFFETNEYCAILDGVILNSEYLNAKYHQKSFQDTLISMYEDNGECFFDEFRGSFSGFFYDKKKEIKIIFTDHIGSKQVFYSKFSEKYIIASDINYIVGFYKNANIHYSLNRNAAYFLLTYGFMIEDHTLVNEIKKLKAGHCIKITQSTFEIKKYYNLCNDPSYSKSEQEIVDHIDGLFRQAVQRAFEKDREYGYKHLVGLSGGLDSRMTTWVANDMGYNEKIVNYTFSQSDYLDETTPKKIASDLKHEWIFKSLDNGLFLKDIDDTTRISSGGALYYGLAHGKSCLDLIAKRQFGIVHTGQLGDVVLGTFYSTLDKSKPFDVSDGAYSMVLKDKLDRSMFSEDYQNEEIFKFYTRGFAGANQGLLVAQEFSETYSPFYDIDFMEYCLSIPVELRANHYIYKKWIIDKYPHAASYVWEKTGARITDKSLNILGRRIPVSKLPKKILDFTLKKLGMAQTYLSSRSHMNPLEYYYATNNDLKIFLQRYFYENVKLLKHDKELFDDCNKLFENQTIIEKIQVITLLSAMKRYFSTV
ncbi:hypothetical protein [Methylomicrobium lacus]|uniref:hypothetical protein n=1 Tax=Methylomicrobium lacus TaxID=136992 RepID=UPI0035A8A359